MFRWSRGIMLASHTHTHTVYVWEASTHTGGTHTCFYTAFFRSQTGIKKPSDILKGPYWFTLSHLSKRSTWWLNPGIPFSLSQTQGFQCTFVPYLPLMKYLKIKCLTPGFGYMVVLTVKRGVCWIKLWQFKLFPFFVIKYAKVFLCY